MVDAAWSGSLSAALDTPGSPVVSHLLDRFPAHLGLMREYRAAAGPLLRAAAEGASPAVLGTSFDLAVRYLLDPSARPEVALTGGLFRASQTDVPVLAELSVADVMDDAERAAESGAGAVRDLVRACVVLAWFTNFFRAGARAAAPLLDWDRTVDDLYARAEASGCIDDVVGLLDVARERLLPSCRPPYHLGPTFAGSHVLKADADLIAGGILLELKVSIGTRRQSDGTRYDQLKRQTLHQLLGYLLLDWDDRYRIRALGVYSARYGRLMVWPLTELLPRLAERPVDLAEERRLFQELLTGLLKR